MSAADLGQMRFAHSPLTELAESLWTVTSQQIRTVHRGWYHQIRGRLRRLDMDLLRTLVPGHRMYLARFLLPEATAPAATIEHQLELLAGMPAEELCREIDDIWRGDALPDAGRRLLRDGAAGPRRVADALAEYWSAAIAPDWAGIRAVLDDDIAHRAATLTRSGLRGLMDSLHDKVVLDHDMLQIGGTSDSDKRLAGSGLLLVPSVFSWPYVVIDFRSEEPSSLTYPARGFGNLWSTPGVSPAEDGALTALLGRSRAAILQSLAVPRSTTGLAVKLGQSPPAVSQHLTVLRRSGLVVSWRSGRSVLYRRTALGTSVVDASGGATGSPDQPASISPGTVA
jgi:DNA-binding transcriptional ArsR family regulator